MDLITLLDELRRNVNSLTSLFKADYHLCAVQDNLTVFDSISNTSHKEFESNKQNFSQIQKDLENTACVSKELYWKDTLAKNNEIFAEICKNPSWFSKIYGFERPSELEGDTEPINAIILKSLRERIGELVHATDTDSGYLYYIDIVCELICPLDEVENRTSFLCPNCNQKAILLSGSEFGVEDADVVYGCHCGCYALASKEGKIIGAVASKNTHALRDETKKIINHLMATCGYSMFEAFRMISYSVGKKIRKNSDIECLTAEECKTAIQWYQKTIERIKRSRYPYPKNRKDLMSVLQKGGRLRVVTSIKPNLTKDKLLIPASVGKEAFMFSTRDGHEVITFSKNLNYNFHNNTMEIIHPSGQKEKYRIYLPIIDYDGEMKKGEAKWQKLQKIRFSKQSQE